MFQDPAAVRTMTRKARGAGTGTRKAKASPVSANDLAVIAELEDLVRRVVLNTARRH